MTTFRFLQLKKKKQNGDDGDIESDSNKLEIPQETVATVLSRLIQGDGDVEATQFVSW